METEPFLGPPSESSTSISKSARRRTRRHFQATASRRVQRNTSTRALRVRSHHSERKSKGHEQQKPKGQWLSTDALFARVIQKVPHRFNLTGKVIFDDSVPTAKGGYGEVYEGDCQVLGYKVAVKRLRIDVGRDSGKRNFARELNVWYRLKHPNVLPLVGYMLEENHLLLVSKWMERGSLRFAMTMLTIRELFSVSVGIAQGLSYLHSRKVIHADLKTDNVLMSPMGVPLLADFGISKLDPSSSSSPAFLSSGSGRGSIRWLAYEIFDCSFDDTNPTELERPLHNEKTDVWAFGMTLLELLTGELPFMNIKHDLRVPAAISRQMLPPEPTFSGSPSCVASQLYLWSICKQCWIMDPTVRPSMDVLLRDMEGHLKGLS